MNQHRIKASFGGGSPPIQPRVNPMGPLLQHLRNLRLSRLRAARFGRQNIFAYANGPNTQGGEVRIRPNPPKVVPRAASTLNSFKWTMVDESMRFDDLLDD